MQARGPGQGCRQRSPLRSDHAGSERRDATSPTTSLGAIAALGDLLRARPATWCSSPRDGSSPQIIIAGVDGGPPPRRRCEILSRAAPVGQSRGDWADLRRAGQRRADRQDGPWVARKKVEVIVAATTSSRFWKNATSGSPRSRSGSIIILSALERSTDQRPWRPPAIGTNRGRRHAVGGVHRHAGNTGRWR